MGDLQNADFESSFDNWTGGSGNWSITSDAYHGTKAAYFGLTQNMISGQVMILQASDNSVLLSQYFCSYGDTVAYTQYTISSLSLSSWVGWDIKIRFVGYQGTPTPTALTSDAFTLGNGGITFWYKCTSYGPIPFRALDFKIDYITAQHYSAPTNIYVDATHTYYLEKTIDGVSGTFVQ